ncbi:MAG TPA: DUF84 family protein [Oligoflexia bacterium]|nr:DUF84 family protein [Oligoflexia bacterium]HMP48394.1 DUF84 family protein [Oligoflexia bacterium]
MKIMLIRGGSLKKEVIGRAFLSLLKVEDPEIFEYEGKTSSLHIISKNDCLKMMRDEIEEARREMPDISYFINMRGRFDDIGHCLEECALVLIQDKNGNESFSQAASFLVPEEISDMVRDGVSFSKAVEQVTGVSGVKEGSGFVGILTKGIVMKDEQYFQPTVIALSGLIQKITSNN